MSGRNGKARSADWDAAKTKYPATVELDERDWLAFFDRRPDVFWTILGDIAKVVTATEAEVKRSGRRPGVTGMSLDDLDRMVSPRYSMEPFSEALKELVGPKRSIRAFAAKVPCSHTTLLRMSWGELPLTLSMLESIATAGKVRPTFFREYRAMYLATVVGKVLDERPNLSIRAVRSLAHAGATVGASQ